MLQTDTSGHQDGFPPLQIVYPVKSDGVKFIMQYHTPRGENYKSAKSEQSIYINGWQKRAR